jgi:hypothetical protein
MKLLEISKKMQELVCPRNTLFYYFIQEMLFIHNFIFCIKNHPNSMDEHALNIIYGFSMGGWTKFC